MARKKNKNKTKSKIIPDKTVSSIQSYVLEIQEHNGWSAQLEQNIEALGNEASTFMWLHRKSATILSDKDERLTFRAAVLTTITTSTTLTSFLLQSFGNIPWLVYTITGLVLLVGFAANILLVYQQSYKFPEKITAHKDGERKHQWSFFQMQGQLQIPAPLRQVGQHFFSWMSHEINGISHIEDIEPEVLKLYKSEFPGNTIPGVDGIRKIIVNTDYTDNYVVNNNNEDRPSSKSSYSSSTSTTPDKTPEAVAAKKSKSQSLLKRSYEPIDADIMQSAFNVDLEKGEIRTPRGRTSTISPDEGVLDALAEEMQTRREKEKETKTKDRDLNILREQFRTRRDLVMNTTPRVVDARLRASHKYTDKKLAYELRRAQDLQQDTIISPRRIYTNITPPQEKVRIPLSHERDNVATDGVIDNLKINLNGVHKGDHVHGRITEDGVELAIRPEIKADTTAEVTADVTVITHSDANSPREGHIVGSGSSEGETSDTNIDDGDVGH